METMLNSRTQWSSQQRKAVASTLKAIAHPMRLSIIDMLAGGKKLTVTEIYTQLKADQSAISHHLSLLKSKGIVKAHRRGKFVHYSLQHQEYLTLIDCLVNKDYAMSAPKQAKAA